MTAGDGPASNTSQDPLRSGTSRAFGLARFEANDFAGAREALADAIRHGARDDDTVTVLAGIASDQGDAIAVADLYEELLDRYGPVGHPSVILGWEWARFDAVRALEKTERSERQITVALDLLAAAAMAEDWSHVLDRRAELESIFVTPTSRLDFLEQLVYAPPETGLPASAAAEIEAIGYRLAPNAALARAAERLLHGLGRTEAAYGVERARRLAAGPDRFPRPRADNPDDLGGATVVIAGGHPPLRRMVTVDLTQSGADGVREIPSKWEAVRAGRGVRDRMAGSDIAVLIGRQLAHSTADQVRSAAARLGIPVARAETASVASVRRAALGARR